jgi:hypothetical protein
MPVLAGLARRVSSSLIVAALFVGSSGAGGAKADEAPSKKEPKKETGIDLSASLGGAVRVGDAPLFDVDRRLGGSFGLGVGYLFHPLAIGLSYERTGFGAERTDVGPFGAARVARALDAVWISMRVRLTGAEPVVPFLGVGLGAAFQSATLGGVFLSPGGTAAPTVFGCSARDGMNLALRALAGAEVPLGKAVSFTGEASFDAYRLSSEVIEGCVPGAGSANAISVRLGFVYRFDRSEGRGRPLPPTSAAQVR